MSDVNVMKSSAENFGFDPTWITDILQKYGQEVLALIVEAARNGFSVSFVMEVIQKFGPALLQFILDLFNHRQTMAETSGDVLTGDVVEGIDAGILDVIIQKYLPIIIQKYLPAIWTQFGPIIMQFIQDNLQTIFDKFGSQIVQMILQLILGTLKAKQ
jgi:hypothetical protein